MNLINLTIDRIIIHQIYRRDAEGNIVQPLQSHDFTKFDSSAMDAFKSRVRDALGDGSKAVQMRIVSQEDDQLPKLVDKITSSDDLTFALGSYEVATKLARSQGRKSIPGGIVVVFTGSQGPHSTSFFGVIKAEIHSAYEKNINKETNEISLKFVQEVLLTPGTRLYKTAAFFQKNLEVNHTENLNEKWDVLISDYQISQADGKAAAQYFYADFLGCGYPETSARTTKKFYEATCEFIESMDVAPEKKFDLYNALTTYLKVHSSTTVVPSDFASDYFDIDTQDAFNSHLKELEVPTIAFTKDNSFIESKLKFRKISFNKNIKIIASAEAFKNLVSIESINGDPDASGAPAAWTRITIKDTISDQE